MKKKKLILALSLLSLFILASGIMLGCVSGKMYNVVRHKISETRENLFVGASENVHVSFMSGTREEDYVINGYNTPLVDFGVVTFKLLSTDLNIMDEPQYVVTVGTMRYDGVLEKNPFDSTYVADIKKKISSDSKIIVKLVAGEFIEEYTLNSVSNSWKLNHVDALKIACKELKTDLELMYQNNEFKGEGYVKIINDTEGKLDNYYWYVNFINRQGQSIAIIIEPNTKEILAKRTFN